MGHIIPVDPLRTKMRRWQAIYLTTVPRTRFLVDSPFPPAPPPDALMLSFLPLALAAAPLADLLPNPRIIDSSVHHLGRDAGSCREQNEERSTPKPMLA